jgi:hypothetical protein
MPPFWEQSHSGGIFIAVLLRNAATTNRCTVFIQKKDYYDKKSNGPDNAFHQ